MVRGGRERAVAAAVAAQPGQRDEDLGGVGDAGAVRGVADLARPGQQLAGREPEQVVAALGRAGLRRDEVRHPATVAAPPATGTGQGVGSASAW